MNDKINVLLINSYSFEKIHQNFLNGINPSHYLMGKIELENSGEFQVDIHVNQKYKWLDQLGKLIKIPFLDQQVRALFILRHYDLIYMPYPLSTSRLLAMFKMIGMIKTPMVGLAHQNFIYYKEKGAFLNKFGIKRLKQFDAFAFFSTKLMEKTGRDLEFTPEEMQDRCFPVRWGADVSFYEKVKALKTSDHVPYAVCAGTADRDYDMLIKAFENIPLRLKIFCTPNTIPNADQLPPNVIVDTTWVPYDQLLQAYANAEFIIIPLKEEIKNKGNTYGLTVLLDALAVGKPVLMTHHSFLDIDLEEEKIGFWVKDNTSSGWESKLRKMISSETDLAEMGKTAKNLHLKKYTIDYFAQQMAGIFKTVLNRKKADS